MMLARVTAFLETLAALLCGLGGSGLGGCDGALEQMGVLRGYFKKEYFNRLPILRNKTTNDPEQDAQQTSSNHRNQHREAEEWMAI